MTHTQTGPLVGHDPDNPLGPGGRQTFRVPSLPTSSPLTRLTNEVHPTVPDPSPSLPCPPFGRSVSSGPGVHQLSNWRTFLVRTDTDPWTRRFPLHTPVGRPTGYGTEYDVPLSSRPTPPRVTSTVLSRSHPDTSVGSRVCGDYRGVVGVLTPTTRDTEPCRRSVPQGLRWTDVRTG